MASCDQLTTWLSEAETALHNVLTGQGVILTRYGDKQVSYSQANVGELRRRIAELQQQVDACNGTRIFRRRVLGIVPVDSNY